MHRRIERLPTRQGLGTGVPGRGDPRVKLIGALSVVLAVVLSTQIVFPLLVLAVFAATLVALRAPLRATAHRLAAPLGVTAAVVVLQAFMTGTTPLVSLPLGPWALTATQEGLWEGLLIGSRVMASVSVLVVLSMCASAAELFAVLRWAKLPRTWIEIAMLMHRYIFTLFERAAAAVSAQKVRLGYGTLRRSLASLGSLAGIVALSSIDQAERTHEAMIVRGFQGTLPIAPLPAMRKKDLLVLAAGVAVIVLAYTLAERWPL
jgi:cobalt/nickel transport system permease protein